MSGAFSRMGVVYIYTKYWLKGGTDINSAYSIEYMQGGRRDWIRLEVRVFDELFASAYLL